MSIKKFSNKFVVCLVRGLINCHIIGLIFAFNNRRLNMRDITIVRIIGLGIVIGLSIVLGLSIAINSIDIVFEVDYIKVEDFVREYTISIGIASGLGIGLGLTPTLRDELCHVREKFIVLAICMAIVFIFSFAFVRVCKIENITGFGIALIIGGVSSIIIDFVTDIINNRWKNLVKRLFNLRKML